MDASARFSRRAVITAAAAATAVPLSCVAWHVLSSSSQGQSASKSTEPGVTPSDSWNPLIRVNLTPAPLDHIRIKVDGPFRILAPGSPRVLAQEKRISESAVRIDGAGIRFGNTTLPISQLEIVAVDPPSIWVGNSQYRGSVRLYRQPGKRLIAINILPLEEYLASVINSEMPASFPDAARQAQAIVARTYALSVMKGHPQFDLFATTRSQKYLGHQYIDGNSRRLAGDSAASRKIIADTSGIVCTWQKKLFTTWYTAVCGGQTINGRSVFTDAVPALKSVQCDWCREADRYRWTSSISSRELTRRLNDHHREDGAQFQPVKSLDRSPGSAGDLPHYTINDGVSAERIAGTTLRRLLPTGMLSSPVFSASFDGDKVHFDGRGAGHGVGLCQWGARGLGIAGRSALEILHFYYSGIETVRLKTP